MAQYNIHSNTLLSNNDKLYEVVMLADSEGNINTGGGNFSGTAVDAFGRARFSQPVTLFDSTNVGGISDDFYHIEEGSPSIVFQPLYNAVSIGVTSSALPQRVVRRSKRRMSYQPGKSLLILATFTMAQARSGLTQKVGYYDDNNGVYLERDGNGVANLVLRRNQSSEVRVPQSQWNGDKLNGVAEDSTSGFTLDLENSQIFWTDIEWLGVGSVRCGFVINGQVIIAHTFHHANIIEGTYMKSANLPVSYEVETDETYDSGATGMMCICCSVVSEGGYESAGTPRIAGTPLTGTSTTSVNWMNLASIKLDDLTAIAVLNGADILNISNSDFEWGIFRNPTYASSLTFPNVLGGVAWDTSAVQLSDTGTRVAGGYLGGKTAPINFGTTDWQYQLGVTSSGSETFSLAVRSSQSKTAAGIIKWIEY